MKIWNKSNKWSMYCLHFFLLNQAFLPVSIYCHCLFPEKPKAKVNCLTKSILRAVIYLILSWGAKTHAASLKKSFEWAMNEIFCWYFHCMLLQFRSLLVLLCCAHFVYGIGDVLIFACIVLLIIIRSTLSIIVIIIIIIIFGWYWKKCCFKRQERIAT